MKRVTTITLSLGAVFLSASAVLAQPLPTDPRLVTGTLDDGLKYIVMRHANPPGRAALYLHVSSGSLNETDVQRGIAHYLEHMAFNGSENFPPGSVVPFFESLGLTFGRHQNAFTSFDQTTFTLEMPDNKPETLEKGLRFFSDVAFRLTLSPAEIDSERQVILEEKRTRLGAQQRVQEKIFAELAPGSIFGQRLPIGTEETILAVKQNDFKDYYSHWYVPSNMTAIVVADMDPAVMAEKIKAAFSGGPKTPKPVDNDIGVKPYTKPRAIVASDPELRDAQISIGWLDKPRPATTTVELFRAELVDNIANWIVNRRMEARVNDGKASYLGAVVFAADLFNAMHIAQVGGQGDPAKWRDMLKDVAEDIQRARIHGFSEQEVQDARREILAGAERAVETEPTLAARQVLGLINSAVASGEPVMSAKQRLEVTSKALPTITAEEVSKRFTAAFDPSAVTFTVQIPSTVPGGIPTEDEVVALGQKAMDVKPSAPSSSSERPAQLLSAKPKAGTVTESAVHEASKVTSAWLSNGVRVHHRFMDYKKDQATVIITLAGGKIEETAKNHGISDVASLAWSKPATAHLTSTNVRDLMTGKKVNVGGGAGADSMSLTISGSPAELESGFELAYLLLTEPKVEQAAFDTWKTATLQSIEQRKVAPQGAVAELMATMLPEGEVRERPLEKPEVEALAVAPAQAWLDRIIKTAPIEVSIVGDITAERSMELAKTYLASLGSRERISSKTLDNLRDMKRPGKEFVAVKEMQTMTPMAIVIGGFYGANADNFPDVRALKVASAVISTRMIKKIREEEQLVYGIGAQHVPSTVYPGWGRFFAAAPTEPAKAEKLAARIKEMLEAFAASGPTEDEMVVARKQIANELDERMKEPAYWSAFTSQQDYVGLSLDEAVVGPSVYQTMSPQTVLETYTKYCKPGNMFMLTVKPAAAPATPATAPAAEPAKPAK